TSERAGERSVENGDAHVEKGLHRPLVPTHLLLLDHPLRQDLVDRAFDKGGRNRQAVTPTRPVVHQRLLVGIKIFDEINDASSGSCCTTNIAGVALVEPVRQPRQPAETGARSSVPESPLGLSEITNNIALKMGA